MDWVLIWSIVSTIIAIITSVSWAVLHNKVSNIITHIKELKAQYDLAGSDNVYDDVEKARIGGIVLEMLPDMLDVWQSLDNLIRAITGFLIKKSVCKR